jgi:octaprenyl-diphosphate synthase
MTYQVIDDYLDKDPLAEGNVDFKEAHQYAAEAKHAIDGFKQSVYKQSLNSMVDYVLSHSN